MINRTYDVLAPVLNAGISLALFCVLALLVARRVYSYWIVLVYTTWELLATLGFTIADILYHGTSNSAIRTPAQLWYTRLYWINDIIVDLFRFTLVIVLIYMASAGVRRVSPRLLASLVLLMTVLPFVLFDLHLRRLQVGSIEIPFPGAAWFNSTSEMLNFGTAIMNLLLWATLLASKRRDPQLLLVSLGLGIVVTGTALGYGVRHILGQHEFSTLGYLFMNLTQLCGWLIWCRAFWPPARSPAVKTPVVSA